MCGDGTRGAGMNEQSRTSLLQRCREAGMLPTVGRIGILQVFEIYGTQAVCVEEVLRQMQLRGMRMAIGTVYRTVREMERVGLLLREWSEGRKALYRVRPAESGPRSIRLVCGQTGRSVVLNDSELSNRIGVLAQIHQLGRSGRQLCTIEVHLSAGSSEEAGVHRLVALDVVRHAPVAQGSAAQIVMNRP